MARSLASVLDVATEELALEEERATDLWVWAFPVLWAKAACGATASAEATAKLIKVVLVMVFIRFTLFLKACNFGIKSVVYKQQIVALVQILAKIFHFYNTFVAFVTTFVSTATALMVGQSAKWAANLMST
ncbi:MAG: hypothetical protein NTX45_17275 [Proteobacteria bacterium]|nr:hypothetical protein [Pseudomonadota bacterium]